MKGYFFVLILIFVITSCGNTNRSTHERKVIFPAAQNLYRGDYAAFLKSVKKNLSDYKNFPKTKISQFLFSLINDSIPFYWEGTKWDYNGTSRIPLKGKIACGYFITNTLTDIGFRIKRIWLAQQPASVIINLITSEVKSFSGYENFVKQVKRLPDNCVFILGLDCHIGYLTKKNGKSFFIHSSYLGDGCVMKEKIEESEALQRSNYFMLGNLSNNLMVLNNWIAGSSIQ